MTNTANEFSRFLSIKDTLQFLVLNMFAKLSVFNRKVNCRYTGRHLTIDNKVFISIYKECLFTQLYPLRYSKDNK